MAESVAGPMLDKVANLPEELAEGRPLPLQQLPTANDANLAFEDMPLAEV